MFYFEQLFQTALGGIDSANVTSTVLSVASAVLLLSFLYSAYEAFAAGGDVRMLATSGIKYLILGLVFANYGTVFRSVNSMFNSVADFIYNSSGAGDVFSNWLNQLAQYWQANGSSSVWSMVTGAASGIISLVLILASFVIFPFCYLIFTVFYAMYGSVLYVTGPLILALLPTRGLGPLSRTYLVNMMTFQAWDDRSSARPGPARSAIPPAGGPGHRCVPATPRSSCGPRSSRQPSAIRRQPLDPRIQLNSIAASPYGLNQA